MEIAIYFRNKEKASRLNLNVLKISNETRRQCPTERNAIRKIQITPLILNLKKKLINFLLAEICEKNIISV